MNYKYNWKMEYVVDYCGSARVGGSFLLYENPYLNFFIEPMVIFIKIFYLSGLSFMNLLYFYLNGLYLYI